MTDLEQSLKNICVINESVLDIMWDRKEGGRITHKLGAFVLFLRNKKFPLIYK